MSCTKLKLAAATIVAAALWSGLLAADAWAACRIVKQDPNCWGDTCATQQVCDRTAMERATRRAPDSWKRAYINRGPFNKSAR
jgi:hypothetical protein